MSVRKEAPVWRKSSACSPKHLPTSRVSPGGSNSECGNHWYQMVKMDRTYVRGSGEEEDDEIVAAEDYKLMDEE